MTRTLVLRLLFCTLLLMPAAAQATFCVDRTYNESHLQLSLCQNHSGFRESRALLYKGRAAALNGYIESLISKGLLQNKKVEIQVDDAALTYPHLELVNNKDHYTIYVSGYPDLQLAGYVHYFTGRTNKTVILAWDTYEKHPEQNQKEIERINHALRAPGLEPFLNESRTVWQESDMKLVYLHDSTWYALGGKRLREKADANLPVQQGRYWLLPQQDSVFVYDHDSSTARFCIPLTDRQDEDYGVEQREGRLDFCWGGCPHTAGKPFNNVCFYYDPRDNKFYIVPAAQR